MMRQTIWKLLLVAAGVGLMGTAAAAMDHGSIASDQFCWQQDGVEGLQAVNDLHTRQSATQSDVQSVSVTDDTVLLAIALANNGASGIDWNSVRSFDKTMTESITASQRASLDRDDVFSALALGIRDSGGSLAALACVSDINSSAERTTTLSQRVALDEDNVLLAIALSNSVGGDLVFDDIASMSHTATTDVRQDRDVTIDRSDTFLALALGNGGSY